jgi:hypothetical protein
VRVEAGDLDAAGSRDEDAREHLQRRRFARAVRSDIADALAGLDREADAVDGPLGAVLPRKQVAHCAP